MQASAAEMGKNYNCDFYDFKTISYVQFFPRNDTYNQPLEQTLQKSQCKAIKLIYSSSNFILDFPFLCICNPNDTLTFSSTLDKIMI